ncbi:hypothetical protein EI969_23955 [Pseudomonas sp. PB101]|nr:hypothetical protein [Pseudomonas sp. PB101]
MPEISRTNITLCGSELARDSGLSVDINCECQSVIASKLAPTGVMFSQLSASGIAQTTAESADFAGYSAAARQSPDRTSTRPSG